MYIQSISFRGINNNNNGKNNFSKPQIPTTPTVRPYQKPEKVSYTPANLTVYKPQKYSYDVKNFQKSGGKLFYDEATLYSIPYSGTLSLNSGYFKITSSYRQGKKENLTVESKDGEVLKFYKVDKKDLREGSRDVRYSTADKEYSFTENYDEYGKLCQTELIQYQNENPENSVMTTFAEDGCTMLAQEITDHTGKDPDGVETTTLQFKDGKLYKKTFEGKNVVVDDRKSKKVVVTFGEDKKPISVEEFRPRYYINSEDTEGYAIAARTVVDPKDNTVTDYMFKTIDFSKGFNPIRKVAYEELINTTRIKTQDGVIKYLNGDTEEVYAIECYEEGQDFPCHITNEKENTFITVKKIGSNVISMQIDDKETGNRKGFAFLRKSQGQWKLSEADTYDENGKKIKREQHGQNGVSTIIHYKDGVEIGKETLVNGEPVED